MFPGSGGVSSTGQNRDLHVGWWVCKSSKGLLDIPSQRAPPITARTGPGPAVSAFVWVCHALGYFLTPCLKRPLLPPAQSTGRAPRTLLPSHLASLSPPSEEWKWELPQRWILGGRPPRLMDMGVRL